MNVSSAIKTAYKEGSHQKNLIVNFPGLNHTVPINEVYYETFSLEESVLESDSLELVGCIASSMEVSIRDFGSEMKGQRVHVSIELDDIPNSSIDLFDGYVDEVTLESNSKIRKIKAYDKLYSISDKNIADWYNNLTFPMTMQSFRSSLFSELGISVASTVLLFDSLLVYKDYDPNELNALTVIKSLCQINAVFGIINRQGVFEFRNWPSASPENVPFYMSMEYSEYATNPITRVTVRQNQDDVGSHYGTGSNNYIIQGNMFTYNYDDTDLHDVAQAIYNRVSGISYIPFEATNYGYPWVEVGLDSFLSYNVYDFDTSQSTGVDSYIPVTAVALYRKLSGIQGIQDDFSAKGDKDQKVFISDVGGQIKAIESTLEELKNSASSEISTYRSTKDMSIEADDRGKIFDVTYDAANGDIAVAEIEVSCVATVIDSSQSARFHVYYFVENNRLAGRISTGQLFEGKNLIHCSQFWENGTKGTYRARAYLYATNCDISILKNRASGYLTLHKGEPQLFQIEVAQEPDKVDYNSGEALDYTGLVVVKSYYDDTPDEDITSLCKITPVEGTRYTGNRTVTCKVVYEEENDVGEKKKYKASFYCYYTEEDPFDDDDFLVDDSTDPYNDGSKQRINIPYVDYTVNTSNHIITLYGFDNLAISSDKPSNVYVPASITTKNGTTFYSDFYHT